MDYFQFHVKDYNSNNEEARESIEMIINSFVDELFWQEYTYPELSIQIEQFENKDSKKNLNNTMRNIDDWNGPKHNVSNLGYQRTLEEIHSILNTLTGVTEIILVDYIKMALFRQIMNPDLDLEQLIISDALGVFIPCKSVKTIKEKFFDEDDNNLKVGNWIVLCPDNIQTYTMDFISSYQKRFVETEDTINSKTPEFVLKKFNNTKDVFLILLKFVLFHEVGHAVFEGHTDVNQIKLILCEEEMTGILDNEALANLFAVHCMSALEQPIIRILHFFRGFEKLDVLLMVESELIIKAGLMNQLMTTYADNIKAGNL